MVHDVQDEQCEHFLTWVDDMAFDELQHVLDHDVVQILGQE